MAKGWLHFRFPVIYVSYTNSYIALSARSVYKYMQEGPLKFIFALGQKCLKMVELVGGDSRRE